MKKELLDKLKELKDKYGAIALKAEIANEIIQPAELSVLKELADKTKMNFVIKVGGCEAGNDIFAAKNINAYSVVAPMIESPYALKKFVNKVFSIYSENERKNLNLFINIETITGYNSIDEILSCKEAEFVKGIIFGRDDMVGSINIEKEKINSEYMFELANVLSMKAKNFDKEFILGGEIRPASQNFLKRLFLTNLTKYETRKIIFESKKSFFLKNVETGIMRAIEFEILWLKYRQNIYGSLYPEEEERLNRLKMSIN